MIDEQKWRKFLKPVTPVTVREPANDPSTPKISHEPTTPEEIALEKRMNRERTLRSWDDINGDSIRR